MEVVAADGGGECGRGSRVIWVVKVGGTCGLYGW